MCGWSSGVCSSDLSAECVMFFFKQKTAYELRISDWSSDVCSSDLRWGDPAQDPQLRRGDDDGQPAGFALPVLLLGHVAVLIQPARGYNIDPVRSYHDPDLVPPHHYFAAYFWLRDRFRADAVIHCGKHGNQIGRAHV